LCLASEGIWLTQYTDQYSCLILVSATLKAFRISLGTDYIKGNTVWKTAVICYIYILKQKSWN